MTTPAPNLRSMVATALALVAGHAAMAQTDSVPVRAAVQHERATMIGVGRTNILDTYLSQETFCGTEFRYVAQTFRQRADSRVSTEWQHHALVSSAGTRGHANTLLTAMYNARFGWHYNWAFPAHGLRLKVGGLLDGTLGGTYNTRNSNNPAQARLSLSIDPSARLSWAFRVGRHPLTMHYEAALPLVGLAFSPGFGQSYYEIFSEGNYDHNIVVTSPFSAIEWHQMLTLDFRLWRRTFTVGYLGDIRQRRANSLKYHQYTHGIVVGWKY